MIFYYDKEKKKIMIMSVVQACSLIEEVGVEAYNEMSRQQRVDAITGQKDTPCLIYSQYAETDNELWATLPLNKS